MKKIGILLFSILLLSLSACKTGFTTKNDNKGKVTLSITGERTVAPVEWQLSNISEWEVTFTPAEGSPITKTTSNTSDTFYVPAGTYTVTVRGESSDPQYTLYGKEEDFVVDASNANNSVVINVSLLKEATGNFSFEITFTNQQLYNDDAEVNTNGYGAVITTMGGINAYLYPLADASAEPIELLVRGEKITTKEPSGSVNGEGYYKFNITNREDDPIPSGFYRFVLKKKDSASRIITLDMDSIVEIADGLTTTVPAYLDTNFSGDILRTYYVNNNPACANNSGLVPGNKKYMPALLEWLKENPEQWQFVNIYFDTEFYSADETNPYNIYKALTPEIDLDLNPTRYNYSEEIDVYVDSKEIVEFRNGTIMIPYRTYKIDEDNYFWFTSDEETTLDLDFNDIQKYFNLHIMTDNVTVACNNVGLETINNYEIVRKNFGSAYNGGESAPYLTVTFKPNMDFNLSDYLFKYIELTEANTPSNEYAAYPLYSVNTNDNEETYYQFECYTDKAGQTNYGISKKVPSFSVTGPEVIKLSDGGNYENVYSVTSYENIPFDEDTVFVWYLNGKKIEDATSNELTIKLGDFNILLGKNVITCVASYDGEAKSESYSFNCVKGYTNIYYRNSDATDDYNKWTSDHQFTDDTNVGAPDGSTEKLCAYCYDSKNNLYVAVLVPATATAIPEVYIYKYEFNASSYKYNLERKEVAHILLPGMDDASPYCPLRMTTTDNNIFCIMTSGNRTNKAYYGGNKVSIIPIETGTSLYSSTYGFPETIVVDDFTDISALYYDKPSKLLYIAGGKAENLYTEETQAERDSSGNQILDEETGLYKVKESPVTVDTQNYDYSINAYSIAKDYHNRNFILTKEKENMIDYSDHGIFNRDTSLAKIEQQSILEKDKFNFRIEMSAFITDMYIVNNVLYANRCVFVDYASSSYFNANGLEIKNRGEYDFKSYQVYGDLLYLYLDTDDLNSIELPKEYLNSVFLPSRILAIKPKKITVCSGSGHDRNIIDYDFNNHTISSLQAPENMTFDQIAYSSSYKNFSTHYYKCYTADAYQAMLNDD